MANQPPRNLRDLQALLKFCLEATKSEDAPNQGSTEPMNEEKKKWLEEAMKSMTVDVIKELGACITVIGDTDILNDSSSNPQPVLEHLEIAEGYVCGIDMACSFHNLGGFLALMFCLSSVHDVIRSGACNLIAELAQNNPYCQEKLLEEKHFNRVLELLNEDKEEVSVKIKALYAISCLTRKNVQVQNEFLASKGLDIFMKLFSIDDEKIKTKCSFLLSALLEENPEVKVQCSKMGFVQLFTSLIMRDHQPWHEYLSKAFLSLCKDNLVAIEELKSLPIDFNNFLKTRCQELVGKEEFIEEHSYCNELQLHLFSNKTQQTIDR